jgi:hypothetical protein
MPEAELVSIRNEEPRHKQYEEVQCRAKSALEFTSFSVTQLYPQAAGSLFLAFYDSQGYGGGLAPCINTLDPNLYRSEWSAS